MELTVFSCLILHQILYMCVYWIWFNNNNKTNKLLWMALCLLFENRICLLSRRCRCHYHKKYCSAMVFVSVCDRISFVWQIVLNASKWSVHSCHSVSKTMNNSLIHNLLHSQNKIISLYSHMEYIQTEKLIHILNLYLSFILNSYQSLPVFWLDLFSNWQHCHRSHRYFHHSISVLSLISIFSTE